MELARAVFGVAITVGPVVVVLILLNRRDRRAARLRHAVLDQLTLPELRGRIAVHIRCDLFSRRRMVTVDLLAATPQEVWQIFIGVADHLPPRVRLLVHGEGQGMRSLTLNTTITRWPTYARRPSFAAG
jgi:hypothetical protein